MSCRGNRVPDTFLFLIKDGLVMSVSGEMAWNLSTDDDIDIIYLREQRWGIQGLCATMKHRG